MSSAHVAQLAVLSQMFGRVLDEVKPASVVIVGVAGGNGLERIDAGVTHRICGIDINPAYLEETRQRFAHLRGLELHCADIMRDDPALALAPCDLVHTALVFEHTGLDGCLDRGLRLVRPGGCFSVVLQLPRQSPEEEIETSFNSIKLLRSEFRLIPPDLLKQLLQERSFLMESETTVPLPSGKAFWMGLFRSP